ncbi:MAG: PfkB family carbohydrate kinase [Chloroflexota bacterium]|nr:PfkB family carbohydrate kinase [Chloroflexota bacterium]
MSIDYLIIGHVTQDLTPTGAVLGGTAYYSTVTAQRLGYQVALVTRAPHSLDLQDALPDVQLHVLPCKHATTFENRYRGNAREQFVRHVAAPITWNDVPDAWRNAPIVHLAPVARDVDLSLVTCFPGSLVCLTPQGWLREWDRGGRVRYAPLASPRRVLRPVDVMVFSAEDVDQEPKAMRRLIDSVPIAVVTQAAEGAVVYTQGSSRALPARPISVVDPTGAGDVFAAAYFVRLHETGDPYEAAVFANVVASFSLESAGSASIPTRAQVDAWLGAQNVSRS